MKIVRRFQTWPTLKFLMETPVYYSVLEFKYNFSTFLFLNFFDIPLSLRDVESKYAKIPI